jgi:hypothetical protein
LNRFWFFKKKFRFGYFFLIKTKPNRKWSPLKKCDHFLLFFFFLIILKVEGFVMNNNYLYL